MKILWLKTELLHPVDKGGKIRTYQMLKEIRKSHHVTYLTLDDGTADLDARQLAEEYAHEVITVPHATTAKFSPRFYVELAGNVVSPFPYALQKYVSAGMRKAITEAVNKTRFDITVCDFLAPAVNVPVGLAMGTLLFQHNVEAMIWRRHFEVATNPLKKAFFRHQWQRMFNYESAACNRFDGIVAVSKDDAETIRRHYGASNVRDIPTGVDTEYFSPGTKSNRANIVFTGSMDWLPNDDAIQWFTSEVLPLVRGSVPDISLTIVGRNPSASLRAICDRDPAVVVTGRVPDVRPYMDDASVYVVPIRIGGGTRLKIYEAMAMELPVVSTTVGAEGLPVEDGREILLRDDAGSFAEAIVKLLNDPAAARKLGSQAANSVRENYGWAKVADDFATVCERTIQNRTRRMDMVKAVEDEGVAMRSEVA